jgi:hypothetical protein
MGITDNDIKVFYEVLKVKENLTDIEKDLLNRLEVIVKGIEVKDKYLSDMEELNKRFSELAKKEA